MWSHEASSYSVGQELKGKTKVSSWSGERLGQGTDPQGALRRPALSYACQTDGQWLQREANGKSRGRSKHREQPDTESPLSNPCLCFLFFFWEGFMSSSVGSFRISDSLTANWKTWKRSPTEPVTPYWARRSDKWPSQVLGWGGSRGLPGSGLSISSVTGDRVATALKLVLIYPDLRKEKYWAQLQLSWLVAFIYCSAYQPWVWADFYQQYLSLLREGNFLHLV